MATMRLMPDDFAPEFIEDDETVSSYARYIRPDGQGRVNLSLGFRRTGSDDEDARMRVALRQSMWQASELVRLGKMEELRQFTGAHGIGLGGPHATEYIGHDRNAGA